MGLGGSGAGELPCTPPSGNGLRTNKRNTYNYLNKVRCFIMYRVGDVSDGMLKDRPPSEKALVVYSKNIIFSKIIDPITKNSRPYYQKK
jgi:hypothetical protein